MVDNILFKRERDPDLFAKLDRICEAAPPITINGLAKHLLKTNADQILVGLGIDPKTIQSAKAG